MDISVIICTYNPRADYLQRVLEALRRQTYPKQQWELLVVDNASKPAVAAQIDLSWHSSARVVCEEKPGLTAARVRGFRETTGDLIVLVDDDNVLAPDFLEKAGAIGKRWFMLGAWGGQLEPEFEIPPPEQLCPFLCILGELKFDADRWSNLPDLYRTVPAGGGMCIRRRVCEAYVEKISTNPKRAGLDRTGNMLLSGGDWDMAMTSTELGLGMGLFRELKLAHLIKKEKLEFSYLLSLTYNAAYSMTWIKHFRGTLKVPYLEVRLAEQLSEWRQERLQRRFLAAHRRGERQAIKEIKQVQKTVCTNGADR